jgi:hypothetical protein
MGLHRRQWFPLPTWLAHSTHRAHCDPGLRVTRGAGCQPEAAKAAAASLQEFPRLLGEAELTRLAAELGSDLNGISPYVFRSRPDILSSAFCVEVRDDNEPFMRTLGRHIRSLDKTLEKLFSRFQVLA